jgi:hypothetical protein
MSGFEVMLTMKGMANLPSSKIVNDFEFIVGNSCHRCPWFIADFISPTVGRLHSFDPSASEFYLDIDDPGHHFAEFLSLGFGSSIRVDEGNLHLFLSLCIELGNREIFQSLLRNCKDPATLARVCERFADSEFFDLSPQYLIEHIASHFYELTSSVSLKLPLRTFAEVLSHPSLRILNEDSLYDIISSLLARDPGYFELLEFVQYEYLSEDRISHFVSWVSNHFDRLNIGIWGSLCSRLKYEICPLSQNPRVSGSYHKFKVESPLDGIIASLTREYGGNVHDLGIVNVSGTVQVSHPTYKFQAKNAVDLSKPNNFCSMGVPSQWICYDFKDRRIRPTHYSIDQFHTHNYLRFWVIEGSLDDVTWTELDRREANTEIHSDHLIGSFSISISNDTPYRFIRLRQTGKNAERNDYLVVYGFELFGLIEFQ